MLLESNHHNPCPHYDSSYSGECSTHTVPTTTATTSTHVPNTQCSISNVLKLADSKLNYKQGLNTKAAPLMCPHYDSYSGERFTHPVLTTAATTLPHVTNTQCSSSNLLQLADAKLNCKLCSYTKVTPSKPCEKKFHVCTKCGKEYAFQSSLSKHIKKEHERTGTVACHLCPTM